MKANVLPSADLLWELFEYNPLTGQLFWRPESMSTTQRKSFLRAGSIDSNRYQNVTINGQGYKLHRVIWKWFHGTDPVDTIDHINRNKIDNRIWNLRDVSNQQNCSNQNTPKNNSSGHKNIWMRRGRYRVAFGRNYKKVYVGTFDTLEEAKLALAEATNIR